MKKHLKKIIAPVIATLFFILYYGVFFFYIILMVEGIWKYVLGIVPCAIFALLIYVCCERLKEIKDGEEDDLSKY